MSQVKAGCGKSARPRKTLDLENEVRGTLKSFGLKFGKVIRGRFAARVRKLAADRPRLRAATEPILKARAALLAKFDRLHRMVLEAVRGDLLCGRLMTVPGAGPITALAFKTGVDVPERFAKSKTVGAHFGLTSRKFNSPKGLRFELDGHRRIKEASANNGLPDPGHLGEVVIEQRRISLARDRKCGGHLIG